ncbi:MAG: hypothetical protein JW838_07605 [Spirochaetes bacterium]|nr:hypothetical protein [Spirochaetota bacterium]
MSMKNHVLLLLALPLLIVAASIKAFAIEPLLLTGSFESYSLFKNAEFIEDTEGGLSLDDVRQSPDWKNTEAEAVNFGFTTSVYWFRFAAANRGYGDRDIFLEINYPMLDYVDLYIPNGNGTYRNKRSGDLIPFSEREVKDRNIMFPIQLPKTPGYFYLRVQTTSSVNFSMRLLSIESYIERLKEELPVFWAYYGVMLALLVFNLMVLLMTRNMSYFFYVCFITAWILFQFTLNGFAFQYLWPEHPWWGNKCLPFFISLVTAACGLIIRTFIQTKKKYPVADRVAMFAMVVPGLAWALVSLMGPYQIAIKGATALALLGSSTMIILAVVLMLRGSRDARFFLFSWFFMLTGIIFYTLKTFGIMPAGFLTNWSIQIGSSATAILLSGALAEHINVMRREVTVLNKNLKDSEMVAKERAVYLEQVVATVKDMSDNMLTVSDDLAAISDKFSKISGEHEMTSADMSSGFDILKNEYNRLLATIVSQREEGGKTRELSGGLQRSQESITTASHAMAESISHISKTTNETEGTLRSLIEKMNLISRGGKSIEDFMTIINDITDRINLLSLNAAIEAARAGEHGRGFAVVADEIGKLALATSDNSKQISSQISSIIGDITEGTDLMNSTKKQLEHTFDIINTITTTTDEVKNLVLGQDTAINRIVTQAGLMDDLSRDIEGTTTRQSETIGSTLNTIGRLAEMARDISNTNSRIMELTALMKDKSFQMSNVIREVG